MAPIKAASRTLLQESRDLIVCIGCAGQYLKLFGNPIKVTPTTAHIGEIIANHLNIAITKVFMDIERTGFEYLDKQKGTAIATLQGEEQLHVNVSPPWLGTSHPHRTKGVKEKLQIEPTFKSRKR
jgi:hypothetical protein